MTGTNNIQLAIFLLFSLFSNSLLLAQDKARIMIYPHKLRELKSGDFTKNRLDRSKYFSTMGMPGGTRFKDPKWEMMKPTRTVGPHLKILDKDYEYEFAIQKKIEKGILDRLKWYQKGFESNQGFKWATAGITVTYPAWMRESGDMHLPVKNNYFENAAIQVNAWLSTLKSYDIPLPTWFTVHNEPTQSWNIRDIAKFHRIMAKSIEEKHEDVKVFGPCWAWTFPGQDLSVWQKFYVDFIAATENTLSGYDMHTYSKGYWAYDSINYKGNRNDMTKKQNHPSLFEGMYNGNENVYDFGTLESQLNMVQAVQNTLYNTGLKPVIVSEYGRQSITPQLGPWQNDFKFFLYMTTVIRQMMLYMDLPEVELAVPFIVAYSGAGYAPDRGQAVYNLQNDPNNRKHSATPFLQFYDYFKDVSGERLHYEVESSEKTFSEYQVFKDANSIYLMAHYGKSVGEYILDLDVTLDQVNTDDIASIGIKRLKWEGEYPEFHNNKNFSGSLVIDSKYQSIPSLNDIRIEGEEMVIVRIKLKSPDQPVTKMVEEAFYARSYLNKVPKNTPHEIKFDLPGAAKNAQKCYVDVAIAVEDGMNDSPLFTFNGKSLGKILNHRHTVGIKHYNSVERVELPVSLLKQGENTLIIEFGKSVSKYNTYLVSAKLIIWTDQ